MANYGAWRVTYTEGRWVVLSGPSSMVVLQPAPAGASQLIDEVWEVVLEAESIASLAAALARFGLDRMPSMAVLFHANGVLKALLRGEVELRDGTTGKVLASGEGADTWFEVTSPSPRVFLHLDDVEPNDMLQLPLVVGVTQASAVLVDVANPVPVATATPNADQDIQVAPAAPVPAEEPAAVASGFEDSVALYDNSAQDTDSSSGDDADLDIAPVVAGGVGAAAGAAVAAAALPDADLAVADIPDPLTAPEAQEPAAAQIAEPAPVPGPVEPQPVADDDLPIIEEDVTEAFAFAPQDIQNLADGTLPGVEPTATPDEIPSAGMQDDEIREAPAGPLAEVVETPAEEPVQNNNRDNQYWGAVTDQPAVDPTAPKLVAVVEPQFDDETPADEEQSQQIIPEGVGMEVTEVLDDVPPYAPGQEPGAQAQSQSFGTQFGNTATGTTGPFGADGFGHLIPASASDGPVQFYDQEMSAPIEQPEPLEPASPVETPVASIPVEQPEPLLPQPAPSFPAEAPEPSVPLSQSEPSIPVPQPESSIQIPQPEPSIPVPRPEPAAPQMPPADTTTQQQAAPQYPPMPAPAPSADPAGLQGHPVEPSFGPRPTMPAPGPKVVAPVTDHDGATVFTTGIAATHKPTTTRTEESAILASVCTLGHPNRPGTHTCRICGGLVDANNPQLVNRPVLAAVVTALGDQVRLTSPVIIGRAPSNQGIDPDAELLRVPSPNHDISRNHVRIAPREWAIEVTDLHSTNGTVVQQPGGEAYRLDPGQTVALEIGDVIDLGDGQILTLTAP